MGGGLSRHNSKTIRMLEVGCATGKDCIQFLNGREDIEIVGVDIQDYGLKQDNFSLKLADAESIPYPDNYFDITVSIGVLEHIVPIEKLSRVIKEIERVSKSFVVIVPSINTVIEPHIARFFWQLQNREKKPKYAGTLIYMSDEAWLAFEGFSGAKSCRYNHIPLFINNLVIYQIAG